MTDRNDSEEKPINPIWGAIHARFRSRSSIDNIEALKRCPIFQHLTNRELKKTSRLIYERSYQAGEYLFEKGQPGTAMFIIKSGMVKVTVPGTETEADLATIMPEDFLGELALLDDTPRSASARAEEKTETLAFFREDLNELADTRPEIAVKIMKGLAVIIGQRLKAANEQLMAGVQ
ncbi:MAG: cyclic nucleotide-binding domain-containing protein [Spirochaetes bacterium]|nr:cyclic nucleotide-binding domain-containing protein [Spirochaetota bacterium]